MSQFDFDAPWDNEWDDCGEVAWNEFDWERYLREQDKALNRYLAFYEARPAGPNRIDRVAEQMGWEAPDAADPESETPAEAEAVEEEAAEFVPGSGVYTLHQNPVFVATRAIYLSLRSPWEVLAADDRVPASAAAAFLASLHRGETQAVEAIHALDFGDYAMAVSLFKRALAVLNDSFAQLQPEPQGWHRSALAYREQAMPKLFDLREIWLRVIRECREELGRPLDEES